MSETEDFLKELGQSDVLNKSIEIESKEPEVVASSDEDGEKLKNRRERRLYERLEKRGEEAQKLSEEVQKLRTVVESQTLRTSEKDSEYKKLIERIYGTNTPEAREATQLLSNSLEKLEESAISKAEERILAKLEAQRDSASAEEREADDELSSTEDYVEDAYGLDFSDPHVRQGYYTLLEKMSRKDKNGNIIEYADPDGVAEYYKDLQSKDTSRNKELASRSMVRSGATQGSQIQQSAQERFLREQGII